jgi:hypothetical protein
MKPTQVLLSRAIDYAGLFPPAGLSMENALLNQADYHSGSDAWALGRFIVPVHRLPELERLAPPGAGWRLSALVGSNVAGDLEQVLSFNQRGGGTHGAVIDAVELKADAAGMISDVMSWIPAEVQMYFEIPIESSVELIPAIAQTSGRAKVRTGGVTAGAFPSTRNLIGFIGACVSSAVPFKATAGLHHPLRAEYPYTYEANSGRGPMFGFLNLFLATALLRNGADSRSASGMLEEGSRAALAVDQRSITWNGHRLDLPGLRRARECMVSFGSCSFTEPLAELRSLDLLEPEVQRT